MKKSNFWLITCLIAAFSLLLMSCTPEAATINPVTPKAPTTDPVSSEPSPTEKPKQSVFMPLISSNISTETPPATAGTSLSTAYPTPPAVTGASPIPANNASSTPSVPPAGDHGENLPPERWQEWPVLPVISEHAIQIFKAGIAQGNDPNHFSKVGDCQNIHQYFLGLFDSVGTYRLGEKYAYLQETIDHFSGNWSRKSEAVRTGFNVASVLAPLLANPDDCLPSETPLACEFRIWNPSFVIISMETWTADRPTSAYEGYLRQIVEYSLSKNVLPILATKADNLEGDDAINLIVARVAADYDIPLWNFWAAVHPLTDQGLMEDRFHLTNGPNFFDDAKSMDLGWPVRNLNGLQIVDTVWKTMR